MRLLPSEPDVWELPARQGLKDRCRLDLGSRASRPADTASDRESGGGSTVDARDLRVPIVRQDREVGMSEAVIEDRQIHHHGDCTNLRLSGPLKLKGPPAWSLQHRTICLAQARCERCGQCHGGDRHHEICIAGLCEQKCVDE